MKIRAALAGTLLFTLTGCASVSPGDAAVVEGRPISVEALQLATQQISQWAEQPVNTSQVLYYLVIDDKTAAAAANAGVGVSTQDAKALLETKITEPSPEAIAAVQANEAIGRLQQLPADKAQAAITQLKADIEATDIQINPRYGTFAVSQISPTNDNWVLSTSATPSK